MDLGISIRPSSQAYENKRLVHVELGISISQHMPQASSHPNAGFATCDLPSSHQILKSSLCFFCNQTALVAMCKLHFKIWIMYVTSCERNQDFSGRALPRPFWQKSGFGPDGPFLAKIVLGKI